MIDLAAIPAACFRGPFGTYREALARSTEATDAYHLAVFALVVGCIVRRRAYLPHGRYIFPNLFTVLIGPTGRSRKTTAVALGRPLFEEFKVETLTSSSWEGLLEALGGDDQRPVLMLPGEFRSLAAKARQEGTSNLIPGLTEAFDCPPELRHKTRSKDLTARRPFVSILTASTPEWLHEAMTANDIAGGFLNRWTFIDGTPKAPMPFPESPDPVLWGRVLQALHDLDSRLRLYPEERGLVLRMADDAKTMWAGYYTKEVSRTHRSELLAQMGERLQDVALKMAMLYTLLEGLDVIGRDQLAAGIAFAVWERQVHERVFEGFGDSKGAALERRILGVLPKLMNGSKSIPVSVLRRAIGGRYDLQQIERTLSGMESLGTIFVAPSKRGKHVGLVQG